MRVAALQELGADLKDARRLEADARQPLIVSVGSSIEDGRRLKV